MRHHRHRGAARAGAVAVPVAVVAVVLGVGGCDESEGDDPNGSGDCNGAGDGDLRVTSEYPVDLEVGSARAAIGGDDLDEDPATVRILTAGARTPPDDEAHDVGLGDTFHR